MAEQTPTYGLDMKNENFKCDTISESTGATGVTADSVLCKDGSVFVPANGAIGETTNAARWIFRTTPRIDASCPLEMGYNNIVSLADPTDPYHAATKNYCDTTFLPLSGGVMTGNITMPEDGWIGIGASVERLVFDGSGGQLDIQGADLDLNSNDILAVATLTMDEDAWIGIGSGSERLIFDGSNDRLEVSSATLYLGSNAVTGVGSITMDEDAWIGISNSTERLVFDGSAGIIEVQGAHTLHVGTNQSQYGDNATYIYQSADSILDLVADGTLAITAPATTVSGTLDLVGNMALGANASVDSDFVLNVNDQTTDKTTGNFIMANLYLYNNATLTGNCTPKGLQADVRWEGVLDGNTCDVYGVIGVTRLYADATSGYGLYFTTQVYGGSTPTLRGVFSQVVQGNTSTLADGGYFFPDIYGTVTDATGCYANTVARNGSTITNYAMFRGVSNLMAGSTVTNFFGLHLKVADGAVSPTTTYGIFLNIINGSTQWGTYVTGETKNYFSGNLGLGDTTPSHKLDIVGDARVQTTGKWYVGDAGTYAYQRADSFYSIVADGAIELGDQTSGNYITADANGFVFLGTAGLPLGEISVRDNAAETAIAVAGTFVQVAIFDTNGLSNNCTPDHTNDHITISKAGWYFVAVSLACVSVAGGGDTFEFEVRKNNGATVFNNVHAHRDMAGGGGDKGSVTMSGIIDLAANDTVELWVTNDDDTSNIIIEDCALSVIQIAGT
jgi:hypothetical protein